jgi:hypothetical protein
VLQQIFRIAHGSRVLVSGVSPKQSFCKVREGETPSPTRETRALPGIIMSRYFFGVGEAETVGETPPSSTAKVQCASTFLPPDFASTMTLHLSRNFFVT